MKIRDLIIENKLSGKQLKLLDPIDDNMTAQDLLDAFKQDVGMPENYGGRLTRQYSNVALRPGQTLADAGIKDGETLIADLAYKAG